MHQHIQDSFPACFLHYHTIIVCVCVFEYLCVCEREIDRQINSDRKRQKENRERNQERQRERTGERKGDRWRETIVEIG